MSLFHKVIERSEKTTGLTAEEIRAYSPGRLRIHLEKKNNTIIKCVSEFPVIGRGNVLRDELVSHDSLNDEIDELLMRACK